MSSTSSAWNHLPYIVAEIILKYATIQRITDYRQWKTRLFLIGVCQQWRDLGKPMVYRDIIFQSRKYRHEIQAMDINKVFTNGFEGLIATNIYLIKSVDALKYVKEALVHMLAPLHYNWLFSTLLALYREDTLFWSGVKTLKIMSSLLGAVSSTTGVEIKTGVDQKDNIQRLMLVARFMQHAVPNVENLYLRGNSKDEITRMFFNKLQSQYSQDVRSIDNTISTVIGTLASTNLTSLNISFDLQELQTLPRIYSKSLKSLQLCQVPPSFSWSFFLQDTDNLQENLVFSELYCLKIAFQINANRVKLASNPRDWRLKANPDHPSKVFFPKLKSLQISGRPEVSDISFSDIFSKHISRLNYVDNSFDEEAFKNANISSVGKLNCRMKKPLLETIEGFYHETNHLLGKIDINQYAFLDISFTAEMQIKPENTMWTNLTDLDVTGIEYSILINLLSRLPSLVSFTVASLRLSPIPDIFEINEEQARSVCAKNAYVFGNPTVGSNKGLLDCVCHLVLSARSLEKLGGMRQLTDKLICFIDENCQEYSHLRNLCLVNEYKTDKETSRMIL
ncbi:hypothetical protein LPJ64_001604 [Coemansia asiatica]|uniref:Uncharacterized protein n=1 Tax=Coemansia asiatica TaxID=1052880 RepID=A0A9W7XPP7_9FUNG|nr:hypothetical protein LPJ64_001604 [Coemansia asiatica]